MLQSRNFWYNKLKKDKTNINLITEHKFWANKCTVEIRKSKKEYFFNKFSNSESNKDMWKSIKEVMYDG